MENKEELTSIILRKEIRLLCDLPINRNQWFTRLEAKTIAKKISPSARFISDEQKSSKYVSTKDIFPKYIKDWSDQGTVNDHPNKQNLLNIYKLLTEEKIEVKQKDTLIVSDNTTSSVILSSWSEQDQNRLDNAIISVKKHSKIKSVLIGPDNTIQIFIRE